MKKKLKYLMGNTVLFAVSSFGSKILSFLFVPFYTAILTTAEYGEIDIVFTTSSLLIFILTLNISDAVLRFVIDDHDNGEQILEYAIKINICGTLLCAVLMFFFEKTRLFNLQQHSYIFLVLYFFVSSLYGSISNYARAIERIKEVAIAGIVTTLVFVICNIIFLLAFNMGAAGYFCASICSVLAAVIYLCISVKINIFQAGTRKKINTQAKKKMLAYSVPLIFNAIAWWINGALDRYCITAISGVDENGVYAVASKIPQIIAVLTGIFGQAWSISAIKDIEQNDSDGFFSTTYKAYNYFFVIMCSLLIGFNIPLSKFLFLNSFYSAWQYSSILVLSTLFSSLGSFLGGAFTRSMKTTIYARTTVFSAVLNVILNVVLIRKIGTMGAAIATTVSFAVMWISRYYFAQKLVAVNANMIKHLLSYLILIAQVFVEHYYRRFSMIQLALFIVIVILYYPESKKMVKYATTIVAPSIFEGTQNEK